MHITHSIYGNYSQLIVGPATLGGQLNSLQVIAVCVCVCECVCVCVSVSVCVCVCVYVCV